MMSGDRDRDTLSPGERRDSVELFEIFAWNPHFETGIAQIDGEHRVLVSLLNRLARCLVLGDDREEGEDEGKGEDFLSPLLAELSEYADHHFHNEEAIWREALPGSDWLRAHEKTHAGFCDYIDEMRSGPRLDRKGLEEVLSYLTRWLAYHILETDKRIAVAVNAIKAGVPMAQALKRADDAMQAECVALIHGVLSMHQRVVAQAMDLVQANALQQRQTERLNEGLSEQAAFNDLVFDNTRDGQIIIDEHHRILRANPAFQRLLGYSEDELKMLHTWDYDANLSETEIRASFESERDLSGVFESAHRRRDGSRVEVEISFASFRWQGARRYHVVVKDLTDRRRAEQERVERLAAEQASRAKSTFLASMSHEIRTPLNAILGFSEMLADAPALRSEQQEHARIIRQSGQHLLNLINDILDLSRIEAGRATIKEAMFDLRTLVSTVMSMFALSAEQKELHLVSELPDEAPLFIQCDEGKLRQIIINLLGNAIKFTQQGAVTLRVRIEREAEDAPLSHHGVGVQAHACWLRVEVEDTGIGIAIDDQVKIFDAFHQVGVVSDVSGTGLGLAICRRLSEVMKGQLSVRSTLGMGSLFTLKVPIQLDQIGAPLSEAKRTMRASDRRTGRGDRRVERRAVRRGSDEARAGHTLSVAPKPGSSGTDAPIMGDQKPSANATLIAQVSRLPDTLKREMLDAVNNGNMNRIEALIVEAGMHQPAVAAPLKTLAERFDYPRLKKLFSS